MAVSWTKTDNWYSELGGVKSPVCSLVTCKRISSVGVSAGFCGIGAARDLSFNLQTKTSTRLDWWEILF